MKVSWTKDDAAHLARRTGFSATKAEVALLLKKGRDGAVDWLLKADSKSAADDDFTIPAGVELVHVPVERLQVWWLRRMLAAKRPLAEKMTLFWHNHFATAWHKLQDVVILHEQNQRLRQHALGSFRDLLFAVSKSPAMILWLDNQSNVQGAPNENFAREVMELFTTGVVDAGGAPNYSETDVEQGARAFTGWQTQDGAFFFNSDDHDHGTKTFKGLTGPLAGEDILAMLAGDPATARRLAWKLFNFFVYEITLDDPLLDPLVALYFQHDTHIKPLVKHILLSAEFQSPQARQQRVKSPMEFLAGSLRMLGAKLSDDPSHETTIGEWTRALGQALCDPPSVFGWKEGAAWVSMNYLLQRNLIAARVAAGRDPIADAVHWQAQSLLGAKSKWSKLTPTEVVERCRIRLGRPELAATTRQLLIQYLSLGDWGAPATFALDDASADEKVRGLVALLLSIPEYQLA